MLTMDWENRIIDSDSSITNIITFKDELRVLESSDIGVLYPPIITYKRVDTGGGAFQHFVDVINSYRGRFPVAGDYQITGNINGDLIPVSGVFVERIKASAFVSLDSGSSVDYTPGKVQSHEVPGNHSLNGGAPVKITMGLVFTETEMITKDHVEAGY